MRILLDTHCWLWIGAEPRRFKPTARELLEDPGNELMLSAASSWEIAIKFGLGRLPLPEPPESFITSRIERSGVVTLAIEHAHAFHVASLPMLHRDPFDRMLIAQAQVEGLRIMTSDERFAPYDVEIEWAA